MKKMNDSVKYQLERAEDALRTALKFADKESVYVISAISKALIEIDNTMFSERIQASAKEGLISIDKEEREDGKMQYNFNYGLDENAYNYIGSGVRGGMANDVITFS
jgi:hypothetical protein